MATFLSVSAIATDQIEQWNSSPNVGTVDIDVQQKTIVITALGSDTDEIFSFEAYDDTDDSPIDIDSITVSGSIGSGLVRIQIAPDPMSSRTVGAARVKTIDLSNATSSELVTLDITSDLGETAGVVVDDVSGTIDVGNDLKNTFAASTVSGNILIDNDLASGATLDLGTSSGDVTITRWLTGDIEIDSFSGDLSINGGSASGDVTIGDDYDGTITCTSSGVSGDWLIDGTLTGAVTLRSISGSLTIGGNYADTITCTAGGVTGDWGTSAAT